MPKVLKARRVMVNPTPRRRIKAAAKKKHKAAAKRAKPVAKKNIGSAIVGVTLGALNPGKKKKGGSTMAKKAKAKKNYSPVRRAKARRAKSTSAMRNPGKHRRRPIRNAGKTGNLVTSSLGVIGGAVGTRMLTQTILGDKNAGMIGYVANAAVAFGLGFGVSKFAKNANLGAMVTLGGFVSLALRVLQDNTPLGRYVNLQLSGMGRRGDLGVGMYEPTTFFVPLDTNPPGGVNTARMSLPAAVAKESQAAAAAAVAASRPAASPAMAGVYTGGSAGRFSAKGRYN